MKLLLSLLFVFMAVNNASAQSVTFENKLKKAQNITLGRVVDYREVQGFIMGEPHVCGYAVEVEVLRALRGREENYTAFVAAGSQPLLGERYLITSYRNPIFAKQGDAAYSYCQMIVPDGEETSLPENGAVELANFIYTTRGGAGGFYGVDPYLARKLGGDWLIDIEGSQDRTSESYVEDDENPMHPTAYTGLDFLSVLQRYWTIINAPSEG